MVLGSRAVGRLGFIAPPAPRTLAVRLPHISTRGTSVHKDCNARFRGRFLLPERPAPKRLPQAAPPKGLPPERPAPKRPPTRKFPQTAPVRSRLPCAKGNLARRCEDCNARRRGRFLLPERAPRKAPRKAPLRNRPHRAKGCSGADWGSRDGLVLGMDLHRAA